jgi:23S rRNA pseudouridine1911/1915/1917 synthase
LDRPVSGIVLFAKTSKGASRLSEQFRNHEVKKIYQALVEGELKKNEETLVNFLIKDEGKNKVKVFDTNVAGSLRAELSYKTISSDGKNTLVEIELKTGRPHQIRAQFTHSGHPLVGDVKYGASAALPDKSIALCAVRLTFKLATSGEWKTVEVEPVFGV